MTLSAKHMPHFCAWICAHPAVKAGPLIALQANVAALVQVLRAEMRESASGTRSMLLALKVILCMTDSETKLARREARMMKAFRGSKRLMALVAYAEHTE